jgi:hypothetical protein
MTDLLDRTNGHRRPAFIAELEAADAAGQRVSAAELGRRFTPPVPAKTASTWVREHRAGRAPAEADPAAPPAIQRPIRPSEPKPTRGRTGHRWQPPKDLVDRWGRPVVGWAVTVLALLLSYSHMRHLAELAGVSWPALAPLLVDGLMAAAVLCLRRNGRYWAAWLALVLAAGAAMALNGLAERPELVELEDVRLWWALLVPAVAAFSLHLVLKR